MYDDLHRMGASGVTRVADFGLSEDIYTRNYYRQSKSDTTVKLPVRWMPPESIADGIFTEKSDVVSATNTIGMQHARSINICWDTACSSIVYAVVLWSNMLGSVHWGTDPLWWNKSSSTPSAPP